MKGWWEAMPHDRRVVVLALMAGLPGVAVSLAFVWLRPYPEALQWADSGTFRWGATTLLLGTWLGFVFALRERVVRPLQTLSNMLAALREGDFSIRVRGAGASGARRAVIPANYPAGP